MLDFALHVDRWIKWKLYTTSKRCCSWHGESGNVEEVEETASPWIECEGGKGKAQIQQQGGCWPKVEGGVDRQREDERG
uniref:Uncharacterized protein n=1 Tax=Oryza sativa subsp. japonica TaxID=39947 RepID=Q5ZA81_ORYSJ|nr:hypothetical protein [Oryza sativa Japonica Group]